MRKKFYNSTEWGIQESELDRIRSKGFDFLNKIGCKKHPILLIKNHLIILLQNSKSYFKIFFKVIVFVLVTWSNVLITPSVPIPELL